MPSTPRRPSRRDFLKTAGQIAAAPCILSSAALGAAGQTLPSNRITTALIGSGGRGRQIIAGGDQVVAVCDADSKHGLLAKIQIEAMSGKKGCTVYRDFREVLSRDDIDAVVIAAPDHWHATMASAAVKANKAVYVEKPLTANIREGRMLADVVRRYGAILQVGSQQRSLEKFIRACELVRNGRIGEVKTVRVEILTRGGRASKPWTPMPVPDELDYDMWLGPAPWAPYHKDRCHYNFRFVSDYSGGDVTNWGAHHLDIAQWGLDVDRSGPVSAVGSGKKNAAGLHDAFYDLSVDFTYENGEKIELRSGGTDVRTGNVKFIGSKGTITVSRENLDADPKSVLTTRIGPDELHLTPEEFPGTHMGHWLNCIRRRKPKAVNVPAEIAHRSATVCHLANLSMELGRELKWDPAAEQFVDDDEANALASRPKRSPWKI